MINTAADIFDVRADRAIQTSVPSHFNANESQRIPS
jgi:hypothetical protein